MTKEEALTILKYNSKVIHQTVNGEAGPNEVEALDMAIKALEQQPSEGKVSVEVYKQVMSERDIAIEQLRELGYSFGEKIRTSNDCVSRKSLLDKLDPLYKEKIKTAPDNMAEGFMQVSNLIKYEPPVTPTRKVGKWIKTGGSFRCSECMSMPEFRDIRRLKYCPNCGVEMRGSENE